VATHISDKAEGELDGDLYQGHSMASAAIDYLPNFAFYTCNQVLIPSDSEVKTLDCELAFESLSLLLLMKLTIITTPNSEQNGVKPSKRSSET